MLITQPVKNTMARIGLNWEDYDGLEGDIVTVTNRFGGDTCETTPLIKKCIETIYHISNSYELGDNSVNISDFDRLRYFVLEVDKDAYMTCVD